MYVMINVAFEIIQAEDVIFIAAVDTDYVGKDIVAN